LERSGPLQSVSGRDLAPTAEQVSSTCHHGWEQAGSPREHPADESVVGDYEAVYPNLMDEVAQRLADQAPADADVADVATAIVDVVAMPEGTRPFRVHIDPADDGAAVVNAVADRIRVEFLGRIGLEDLLHPHAAAAH
jgi:hypothetical protein